MTDHADLEPVVRAFLRAREARRPNPAHLLRRVVAEAPAVPQRRHWWQDRIRTGGTGLAADERGRLEQPRLLFASMAGASLLFVVASFALVLLTIGRPADHAPAAADVVLPPRTGPANNGLVAYSWDGDIYVGDPVTGEPRAIVTNPARDSHPVFSPDGTRIAFLRGDPWTAEASIVVVRSDGGDERIVMPAGYASAISIAWTPDGASLLVNHDSEPRSATSYFAGELSLVDASGTGDPWLITPPLPRAPGGPYFIGEVAPMFRPPNGDMILTTDGPSLAPGRGEGEHIYAWDADLEHQKEIPLDALGTGEPYGIASWALSWAPDGSRIAFRVGAHGPDEKEPSFAGVYILDADGSDLQSVPELGAWSPDSTRMAIVRGCPDPERPGGAAIAIIDLVSRTERVLDASIVETKTEGSPPPWSAQDECRNGWYDGPDGRVYDYEGWSWSPDGSSILMLDQPGAHPLIIDAETGVPTELPWVTDSAPSWQRVAGGEYGER